MNERVIAPCCVFMKDIKTPQIIWDILKLCFLGEGTWCTWGANAGIGNVIADSARTEIVGDAVEDVIRGGDLGGDETFRGIDGYEPGRSTKH